MLGTQGAGCEGHNQKMPLDPLALQLMGSLVCIRGEPRGAGGGGRVVQDEGVSRETHHEPIEIGTGQVRPLEDP